jgi:leucyl aminopeptidase
VPTPHVAALTLASSAAARTTAEALVVGVRPRDGHGVEVVGDPAVVDAELAAALEASLVALGARGSVGELTRLPGVGTKAPVVLAVGLGAGTPDADALRDAAAVAARALTGTRSAAFALPAADTAEVGAVAEGALLGAYSFRRYKTSTAAHEEPLQKVKVLSSAARSSSAKQAATRATVVAEAVHRARHWVNTAPSDLTPASFADAAGTLARAAGLGVEVLDERALRRKGYGGLLGVGAGSEHPPRLLRLHHKPAKPVGRVALVGKGITFDSGGLSLKPADAMKTMKCDMSGAAAVVAAAIAIAELGLPVEVVAYAALAENMPSGTATRVGDVLHLYGGRTVEVLNTDAEGRLVLADALVRCQEDRPDLVIDVATLTGACVVALGTRIAGLFARDEAVATRVQRAADAVGDRLWPLPIPDDIRAKLDSTVADLANVGDRAGGALQAASFLAAFVEPDVAWAHLDVAGPAFNEGGPHGVSPSGGTGFPVRTLVQLVADVAAKR